MTGGLTRRATLEPVKPSINVTPLVDVVLVLLIIFMVVVPQLDQEVALDLPGIFNVDPQHKASQPFTVSVARAGEFVFEGQTYTLDALVESLEGAHAADPQRRIVLRADANLRYADIRGLQQRLQQVGFPGMSFSVTQRHRYEEEAAVGSAAH